MTQDVWIGSDFPRLEIPCQYIKSDKSIDMIWRPKPGHFLIAKEYKAWATCNLFGSLKK
jgi:hypothetical protein